VKVKAKASNLVGTAVPSLALTSTSSSLKTGDAAGVFQQQDSTQQQSRAAAAAAGCI